MLFISGFVVGVLAGFLFAALCVAASDRGDRDE